MDSILISKRKKPIKLWDKIKCFALTFRERESSNNQVILKLDVDDGIGDVGQITLIISKADFSEIIQCAEFIKNLSRR